jgi:hypothetical protein
MSTGWCHAVWAPIAVGLGGVVIDGLIFRRYRWMAYVLSLLLGKVLICYA